MQTLAHLLAPTVTLLSPWPLSMFGATTSIAYEQVWPCPVADPRDGTGYQRQLHQDRKKQHVVETRIQESQR